MNYTFQSAQPNTILSTEGGTVTLPCFAEIEYKFIGSKYISIKIDDYSFSHADINELIELLKALQTKMIPVHHQNPT